ncbi:hypothetical protein RQP46_009390 [Phenoliferia psychrophenolica]
MGLSKKDARTREQAAKEKAGTKVEVGAGGVPKKAPKPMIDCTVCKKSLIMTASVTLRDHANTHPKVTPAACFPGAVIAA